MILRTPDWLAQHGGELRSLNGGQSWNVYLGSEPHYLLVPVPVKGQHGCQVMQMNNGRRLDSSSAYPTGEAALHGGLEDLRKALGW